MSANGRTARKMDVGLPFRDFPEPGREPAPSGPVWATARSLARAVTVCSCFLRLGLRSLWGIRGPCLLGVFLDHLLTSAWAVRDDGQIDLGE